MSWEITVEEWRSRDEALHARMQQLARAWSEQDTEVGPACFTPDAVYSEPPDIQCYIGHDQLRPYFGYL